MTELQKASHCAFKIRYHMVLVVKYRKKLLGDEKRVAFLVETMKGIGKRYDIMFEAIGTDGDHVHIFVGAAPRYSPARIMQIVKSITARKLFEKFPVIKKELWGGEFWSDGGYVGTVGDGVTTDIIRTYIERQATVEEKDSYRQMQLFEFEV